MKIVYDRKFKQSYKLKIKDHKNLVAQIRDIVELLLSDSHSKDLDIHPLQGSMKGLYSITVDADLRIVYKKTKQALILLDIGSHKEVYHK